MTKEKEKNLKDYFDNVIQFINENFLESLSTIIIIICIFSYFIFTLIFIFILLFISTFTFVSIFICLFSIIYNCTRI